MTPLDQPIDRLLADLAAGRLAAEQLMSAALARAEAVQARCNAFTELYAEEALAQARAIDAARASGAELGPLAGLPLAIKDTTPSRGHRTTLGSWTSGEGRTEQDSVVVGRLRGAGAVILGKTTTPEFAWSSFTRSLRYGQTRNPWDLSRSSGGSSGGAGVAVATRVVPLAEGSDMGGSIRIPAAFCGVVGFKPSLGRIPMTVLPSAMDDISHTGPLATSVRAAALFTAAVAGPSPADMRSQPRGFDLAATGARDPRGLRLALSPDLGHYAIAPEVAAALEHAAERLAAAGATVERVTLPWTRRVADSWGVLWKVFLEAFYGERRERGGVDPDLAAFMAAAHTVSAVEVKRIEFLRSAMHADLAALFGRFDALICPTCAHVAPPLTATDAEYEVDLPDGRYRGLDLTCPFNLVASHPALSLPLPATPGGLPVGLQIVAPPFADEAALSIAATCEAVLGPAAAAPVAD